MRSFTMIALLALAAGCSDGRTGQEGGSETAATENAPSGEVGQTKQAAQFADDTVLNLVDPGFTVLSLTAMANPTTVQVRYIGDKTTDSGSTVGADTVVANISLAANQTATHIVNLFDPSFKNGYGAIFLSSTDGSLFQTYAEYGSSVFSVGGSTFQGGAYRLPYLLTTVQVVLVVTNQTSNPIDVSFQNVGGTDFKTITLPADSTYRFDTSALHWHLNPPNSIDITTDNSGIFSLSGYIQRILDRQRITPVKAAPFL